MMPSVKQTLLHQTLELNGQGILALAHGKPCRSSILAIKKAMQTIDRVYDHAIASEAASPAPHQQEQPQLQPALICRTVPVASLQNDNFYIFNHAFLLQCSPATLLGANGANLESNELAFCCAALTYNMALTYHELGRQLGDTRKLRTACLLYGKVVEMAMNVEASSSSGMVAASDSSFSSVLFFLHMVALNNAAQIQHCYMANYQECDELLARVRDMLRQLFESTGVTGIETAMAFLPQGSLDEIKLNTVVCVVPHTAATA